MMLWAGSAVAAPFSAVTHDVYPGDFNGDGKSDLLVIAKDPAALSGIYATDEASGQPSTQLQSWHSGFLGINWHDSRYTAVIGNFDGVNGDDVLLQRNGSGRSFLLPTNSQGELTGVSHPIDGWGTDTYRILAGRFNADGRADVFLQARQPSGNSSVMLSDDAGHLTVAIQMWANNHLGFKWSVANAIVHVGDFDGDQRDDLLVQAKAEIVLIDYDIPIPVPAHKANSFGIILATPDGQFVSSYDLFSRKEFGVDFAPTEVDLVVGKFNDDGKADILLLARKAGQASFVVLTDGNGQIGASVVAIAPGTLGAELRTLAADFDGDGRSEVYRLASTGGGSNSIVSFTGSGGIAANITHSPPPISNSMGTLVGRLPGEFGVDNSGAATYEIPIDVPEGTNGLKPDLSLVYNSMADNGGLGVGWSLSGFSAITRCLSTLEQDTVVRGVELTSNDRFCLDGNKLRTTNGGGYGANATTYQTEVETFSRVTSYTGGAAGYVPASGPQYFKVESKDGLYLYYGSTIDARIEVTGTAVPKAWALNRIEDRDGNFMTIAYTKGTDSGGAFNGSFRPASIEWARTGAGTGPFFRTIFIYEPRPASDVETSFFAGGYSIEDKRLDRLEVQAFQGGSWTIVRQYDVTYEATVSSTGSGRVKSITQCSATECLPATTFQYQNGAVGWANTDLVYPADMAAIMASSHAIDIDGDARSDLVFPKNGTWWFMRSTGSGYTTAQNSSIEAGSGANNFYQGARAIRRPQSGSMGLLIRNSANLQILRWNGSTLVQSATSVPGSSLTGSQWVSDFDGDGIDDYLYPQIASGQAQFYLRKGFIAGSGEIDFAAPLLMVTTAMSGSMTPMTLPDATASIDVNADGKADVFFESSANMVRSGIVLVSNGNGFTSLPAWSCAQDGTLDAAVHCIGLALLGDFNGDSLTDVFYPTRTGGVNRHEIRFGSGAGLSAPLVVTLPFFPLAGMYAIDFDNDGRSDIVGNCSDLCAYRFNGSGFEAAVTASQGMPVIENGTLRLVDIDANGQVDIAYQATKACSTTASCAVAGTWRVRVHNGADVTPDLLTRVTDGFGNFAAPVYALLTDAAVYTKGSGATYPTVDVLAPMPVVKEYSANTGIAAPATYSVSYRYKAARTNLRGRGFLGFQERTRTDNRPGNQLKTVETYRQDFPYIGNVAASTVYQPDGTTKISQVNTTYDLLLLDGTAGNARTLPYTRTALQYKYEVGGPNNGELVTSSTTTNTIDNYGNLTLQEVAAVDEFLGSPLQGSVYRSFSDNTYAPNTTTWCLGVVQSARVKSQPAGASTPTTRTKSFLVDGSKCRAMQEQIEPGDPKLQVTTDIAYYPLGHPSAGQISSRTVTGINLLPRLTSYEYHPAGPLVTKTTDALVHSTSTDWNIALGFATARYDLNGKRVDYGSDSLGRLTSEARPDGTRIDYRYFACSSGCGIGIGRFQIVTTESGLGTISKQSATVFDSLGREAQLTNWLFAGAQAHILTEYDAMGRVARKSAPLFTGYPIYWSTTTYDSIGRPLTEQRQVSETDTSVQSITWSHEGLRTRQTDAEGKTIIQRTDAVGQTREMIDGLGTHTWYEYDAFGNGLRTFVGGADGTPTPGTIIASDYDLRGRKKSSNDPDMGLWTYTYDALDQLVAQVDAKNQTITQSYDKVGRLIQRQENEGMSTWVYDSAPNGIGLIHTVTSPGGYGEVHGYDSLGRHVSETTAIDGSQYTVNAAFNAFGQVESLEYPQSYPVGYRFKIRYVYDNGLLKQVEDATNAGTVYWRALNTDASGEVISEQLGNGVGTSSWYDNVSGVLRQRDSGPGSNGSVQALQYQWDRRGNLTQRRDNNQNVTENFYYDSLYRLDYSTLTTGTTTVTNLDLSYDALGNITSMTGNGTYTYHPTKKHAVVSTSSGQSFGYDANGNMTSRNSSAISWYSYNLPKRLQQGSDSAEFFYNAARDRYKQIAIDPNGTETTVYIGNLMERVVKANGVIEFKHNIPGADGGAAIYTRRTNGVYDTRYLTKDHLGSVDTISNETGTVLARLNYDAFGRRRGLLSGDLTVINAVTHLGFTGQEMLDNVELVHLNGRVYDPLSGRFISADPFVQDPLASQSLNRYSYVANNPLSYIDPSGYSFLSKIGKKIARGFKSLAKFFVREVVANLVQAVVTVACVAATRGADGGGAGCSYLGRAAGAFVRSRLYRQGGGARGPPSGNIFSAPAGPSLPPGTIVFVGAAAAGVEVSRPQAEDLSGDVLIEILASAGVAQVLGGDTPGNEPKNIDNNVVLNGTLISNGDIKITREGTLTVFTVNFRYGDYRGSRFTPELKKEVNKLLNRTFQRGKDRIKVQINLVASAPGYANLPNLTIVRCPYDECGDTSNAARGGGVLSFGATRDGTFVHELLHALGLGHQANNTKSIMSYAEVRKVRYEDVKRLVDAYAEELRKRGK